MCDYETEKAEILENTSGVHELAWFIRFRDEVLADLKAREGALVRGGGSLSRTRRGIDGNVPVPFQLASDGRGRIAAGNGDAQGDFRRQCGGLATSNFYPGMSVLERFAIWLASDTPPADENDPRQFDDPNGCQAVVAVGNDGSYLMLERPNLWVFECEPNPQDNGFGDSYDLPSGVYRMTYAFHVHMDFESGRVDDWEFEVVSAVCLWLQGESWWRRLLRSIGFFRHNVL